MDDVDPALPPGLTPAQREAIEAADPLLCVLAGAGAGKTRVLTLRVARRIHEGEADPDRVLVCTFSRKAADELRRRLWSLDVGEGVRAGTFHRTALSLLRQHRADHRLAPPEVLPDRRALLATIADRSASASPADAGEAPPGATRRGGRGRSGGSRATRPALVAQLDGEIGWAKARLLRPGDYAAEAARHGRRTLLPHDRIAELYERYEEARRRQRLLDFDDLLCTCADVLATDMAFADAVRWRFRHLFVDEMQDVNPAQFRLLTSLLGDEPDLMVVGDPNQSVYGFNGADPTLIGRLPGLLPGTRVIRLDENHRCSPQVVAVATAALGLGSGPARRRDPAGRGEEVPTSTRPDGPVPRITVHETDTAEAEWLAHQVWLAHRPGRRWSQIAVLARTNAQLDLVARVMQRALVPCAHAGGDLAPASDLRSSSSGLGDPADGSSGGGDHRADTEEPDPDRVVLATFHRAKGLQWPTVFVIGLSDGLVPVSSARGAAAREEERRLLYVALTRAEDELACSWARFRDDQAGSPGGERAASPWLDAITRATEHLQTQSKPLGPRAAAARVAELRARLGAGGPRA